MGERASWVIDVALDVSWGVEGDLSSSTNDNPPTSGPVSAVTADSTSDKADSTAWTADELA